MVGGGRPLLPEILDERVPVPSKTPIFHRFWLVTFSDKKLNYHYEIHYALSDEP